MIGKSFKNIVATTFAVAASNSLHKERADYVCGGVDDQVQIQAVIDALPNNGGAIALMEGEFNISSPIVINKPLKLFGTGLGGSPYGYTYLYLADGANCDIIQVNMQTDKYFFPIIFNIGIDGNRVNNAASGWGINQIKCYNLQVQDCMIAQCRSGGIKMQHGSSHMIKGSCIEFNSGPGLSIDNPNSFLETIRFIGNHVSDNGYDMWLKDWNPAKFSSVLVVGNEFAGSSNAIHINNASNMVISSNTFLRKASDYHPIYLTDSDTILINGNLINMDNPGSALYGIYIGANSDYIDVLGNRITDTSYDKVYVVNGFPTNNANGVIKNNSESGTVQYSNLFMDVLAVSATHVRTNEDLSAAIPITFTIDAQPDIPRTLSGHFDTYANITAYTIEIVGVDAKGNTITEIKTEDDGWDWETNNAFATITSIKMTARTGTGTIDTMDIGITDVLGLSNIIYVTGDVFKIKKNNANATVATAQVNTTYDTYDMAIIGLVATDNFTIYYKSNLNIIE